MEADAIKLIQDSNAETVQAVNGLLSPFGYAAVPDGYQFRDMEKVMPSRRRQRNHYVTESLEDFVTYVIGHDGEDIPKVFAQPRDLTALCIFNVGDADTPGHLDDTATLKLASTDGYLSMQGIHGKTLSQVDFLDWLDDHAENVKDFANANGEPVHHAAALAALRTFTVDKVHSVSAAQHDVRRELGDLERIEVRDANSFPTHFTYRVEPAVGVPAVSVDVKITPAVIVDTRANVERKTPSFRVRVRALDTFREAVSRTFVLELQRRLNEDGDRDVPVLVGMLSPGA